jgi:hypothetical protein
LIDRTRPPLSVWVKIAPAVPVLIVKAAGFSVSSLKPETESSMTYFTGL